MGSLSSIRVLIMLIIVLLVTVSPVSQVLAQYRYVDLHYLITYENSFLGENVVTYGIFRTDVLFLPESSANAVLQVVNSSYECLSIYFNYLYFIEIPPNGSIITIYGVANYGFWGDCVFTVYKWEYGTFSWWNPADIDYNYKVDISDVSHVVSHYRSVFSDSDWDPFCDIAEPYGIIDIYDVVMVAGSYGEEYNP